MSTIAFSSLSSWRRALRGLWRHPGFTVAAVITLGLGIGATTAIFAVVYGVLIRPLPYPDADALVSIRHAAPGHPYGAGGDALGSSASMYLTYRRESRTFEDVGLWGASESTLTGLGEPTRIRTLAVTAGTLEALGVQPALGRGFSDAEHTPIAEGPDPVILTHAFWQSRFGGDESVLGRTLALNDRPSQIVGVMPAGFRFLDLKPQPDVIGATRIDAGSLTLGNLNSSGLARLRDGVTLADANADVARMLSIWLDAWPAAGRSRDAVADWRVTPALRPLKVDVVGGAGGMLWVLMGSVGAVLLIGCANVANLLLVRADARRHELAIRAALGASRRRIAAELLGDGFVLGALGGIAGVGLAYAGLELLAAMAPANLPRAGDIAVDAPVLVFAAAAALVSSLIFGSIPAVKHALAREPLPRAGTRAASASRERNHTRNALIVAQVALALVLLVGAGLMLRTFEALTDVDPGFRDPERIQLARIFIPPTVMLEPARFNRAYREILERLQALPGVTAAGFGPVPLTGPGFRGEIAVEGRPPPADPSSPSVGFHSPSPGYFDALGTRLVAGRGLTWDDTDEARPVALVSEDLARALWGEPRAAIGRRVRSAQETAGRWLEIVGVTQNVHETLYQPPRPTLYRPMRMQDDLRAITFTIRSDRAGTESLADEVRRAVWASHPDLAVFDVRTMREVYSASLATSSFVLVLLAIAGSMALLLSIVGIYAVVAYVVSQRAREIGIRLALGAETRAVERMFVARSLRVAAIGVVAGLAAAGVASRSMAALLFDVPPLDPATYLAALCVLLAAAALAAYVPARRAAGLDPAAALRAE